MGREPQTPPPITAEARIETPPTSQAAGQGEAVLLQTGSSEPSLQRQSRTRMRSPSASHQRAVARYRSISGQHEAAVGSRVSSKA